MKRKVFSGMRRAIVERQAENWLARQSSSFDLHSAITRPRNGGGGVIVTVFYDRGTKVPRRHGQGRLAA
ncbi:MAG: hypothetical protein JSR91_04245 [Proteobacteria bacterium]|nr:hypothetical protein [Pseudomonadota bacterium]